MKLKFVAFVLSLAAFTGCEQFFNEDTTSPDGSTPFITINAPYDNSVFTSGQAVNIKTKITDKDKVDQVEVRVTRAEGAAQQVWGFTSYPKRNPVFLDTTFSAAGLPAGNYVLTVNSIDGRTNVGTKEIHFSLK